MTVNPPSKIKKRIGIKEDRAHGGGGFPRGVDLRISVRVGDRPVQGQAALRKVKIAGGDDAHHLGWTQPGVQQDISPQTVRVAFSIFRKDGCLLKGIGVFFG